MTIDENSGPDDRGHIAGAHCAADEGFSGARADGALRDREAHYRAMVDGMEDLAIVALDGTGMIEIWNSGAERLIGFIQEEAVGQPGTIFFTPEDIAAGVPGQEMDRARTERRATNERWHRRRDGSRFWGSGLMMRREGTGGYVKVFRDRTAEHEADAMARAELERYKALFGAIDAGFCIADVVFDDAGHPIDHQFVETNPAFERQTGLNDAVGKRATQLAPGIEQRWHDVYGKVALSGVAVRFEERAEPLNRWYDVHVLPTSDRDAHRVAVLFNDITARRLAEDRLRDLNETLEAQIAERTAERDRTWQVSRDLLAVIDPAGIVLSVNPAWRHILGWQSQEIVGQTTDWIHHPDDREKTQAEFAKLIAGQTILSFENRLRASDGTYRWLSWTAVPEGDRIYAVARDVTADKEQEAELVRTQEALRQAQKMEAVGQLTGGLAHDFNNLLTGVMGNLELLQMRIARGRTDDLDRFINAAQGAGRRAASLTQRLLAFSRRQTLDPKATDVNRLIVGIEELVRRTVGATVDIEIVQAAGLWTAEIDASQLENAVINLCINGRDAMPAGGRITIETANKWIDDRTGRERDLAPGQYISVCVTDTGSGMSPDTIERAVEPFYTTKPLGQGTGLGLSMIYGFAKQSGGQVRIYSEVGQGTTVCIYLPRHHGDAQDSAEEGVATMATSTHSQTVLVVDDEATIRHLIDEVLDDLGYTVIGAADGAAGIKVLQSGARIELLITDVGLPGGMNGRQVADEARRLRPGLKVLFITGFAENAAVGNGHLEPGMELLTKPFTLEALSTKVAEMTAH